MGCCFFSTGFTKNECLLFQPSGLAIYKNDHQTLQQRHPKNIHQVNVGYFF